MDSVCRNCGCSECLTIANAQALGLEQEFRSAVYSCCQLAEWADEQRIAWFAASRDDAASAAEVATDAASADAELVLMPVRLRRPQVPWFRYPEDWHK